MLSELVDIHSHEGRWSSRLKGFGLSHCLLFLVVAKSERHKPCADMVSYQRDSTVILFKIVPGLCFL